MHLDGGEKPVFFCHKCGEQLEYKEFSKPLDYNRKKVYGYSQCPNHEEHFVVYPYAKGVKEFVKKMKFPNKKE